MSSTQMVPLSSQVKAEAEAETETDEKPLQLLISDVTSLKSVVSNDSKNSLEKEGYPEHTYVKYEHDAAQEKNASINRKENLEIFSFTEAHHSPNKNDKVSSACASSKSNVYTCANVILTTTVTVTSSDKTGTTSVCKPISADFIDTKHEQNSTPTQNSLRHHKNTRHVSLAPLQTRQNEPYMCKPSTLSHAASETISVCKYNVSHVPGSVSSTPLSLPTPPFITSVNNARAGANTLIFPHPTILCSSTIPLNSPSAKTLKTPVVSPISLQETNSITSQTLSSNTPSVIWASIRPKVSLFPNVTTTSSSTIPLLCSFVNPCTQTASPVVSGLCNRTMSSNNMSSKSQPLVLALPVSQTVSFLSPGTVTGVSYSIPINTHNNQINSVSSPAAMIYTTTVASQVPSTSLTSSFNHPVSHCVPPKNCSLKKYKHTATNTMPVHFQNVGVNTDLVSLNLTEHSALHNSLKTNEAALPDASTSSIITNVHQKVTADSLTVSERTIKEEPDSPTLAATMDTDSMSCLTSKNTIPHSRIQCSTDLSKSNVFSSANPISVSHLGDSIPFIASHSSPKRTDTLTVHSETSESPASLSLEKKKRRRSISPDCSMSSNVSSDVKMKRERNSVMEKSLKKSMCCDKIIEANEKGVEINSKSNVSSLLSVPGGELCANNTSLDNKEMQAAIVAENEADPLTEEEINFVQKNLIQLLKQALLLPDSPELRFHNSCIIEPGWLLCYCQNVISLEWLLSLNPMISPGGRLLKIVRASELPWPSKIRFFVNSNEIDIGVMLSLLQQQNKKLRVEKWRMDNNNVEETKGSSFTFLVDSESEKALEEYQWTLCYEFTIIQVHRVN